VITDGHGIPLAATLTGGNRHGVTQLLPLIEAIPPIRGRRGRPRRRPVKVLADSAYDHDKYRALVQAKGIRPVIARRGVPARLRTGQVPLRRGAGHRAVALVPAAADPLGGPPRHPRSIPEHRLRHHLLATPQDPRIVLGPLRRPLQDKIALLLALAG